MSLFEKETFDIHSMIRKNAKAAIALAIVGIIIGVLFICLPLATQAVLIWIIVGLIALLGLGGIIRFIFPGKSRRDGWMLAFSIVSLALAVVLIVTACVYPAKDGVSGFEIVSGILIQVLSVFIGVLAIFNAIFTLCTISQVEEKKAFVIITAILSIVLGILMIVFPFVLTIVRGIIAGVYLIIYSIYCIWFATKVLGATKEVKKEDTIDNE